MNRQLLVTYVLAMLATPAAAQPWRYVPPGPGVPPHLSSPSPRHTFGVGTVRPVQPVSPQPPGYGWYGAQPWRSRGWVNTIGIVPGNVYFPPDPRPVILNLPGRSAATTPAVVSPQRSRPVRPQVLEFNEKTGRLEDVSPGTRRTPSTNEDGE